MRLTTTILMICMVVGAAGASVPPMINYQGKLMQPSGAPVPDNTYTMQFAIYDEPAGTHAALWSETNTAVQVKGGLFAVMLGSITNLPANIFDEPSRFFGVTVGTDPEMTPRQKIASVAYAQVAGTAQTVEDGAITTSKLAPGAVTTTKLARASVTADRITPSAGVPVGTVLPFAGAAVPQGWLLCDGSAISRSAYPELFAAIGAIWGSGDGTSTFNLPDLRGRFLRGQDAGAGIDPDRASRTASKPGGNTGDVVGSVQSDAFQGHYHRTIGSQYPQAWTGITGIVDIQNAQDAWTGAREPSSDGSHGNPRTASETRPVNAYVNFIISTGR